MGINIDDLRDSKEFLNILLDNINAAVLIADEDFRIYRFNDSFLSLFEESPGKVFGNTFGKAMGCIHTVNEQSACGETSKCDECAIRRSLKDTMVKKVPIDRMRLDKIFYIDGETKRKFLEVTTRPIFFQGRQMILVILYDITENELQKIELQRKQQQLDKDLEAAALIQQSLLPEFVSKINNIKVAWKFEPCSSIGGDIFNICYPDKDHMGFYLLDVCGHGVFAALISVAVSQFLRGKIGDLVNKEGITSPEMVLNSLNQAFPFERFDSYFSMIYMIIDHAHGIATYSCAGHPPPVAVRSQGDIDVLGYRGPAIGMDKDVRYGQEEKKLLPGDKILLYSDGMFENRNPMGESFGRRRFYHFLKQNSRKTIMDLVDGVFESIKDFDETAAPEDDMSILGVEYLG